MATNLTSPPPRSGGKRGANFPKSQNGTRVSVSPGKGGVNIGSPRHCAATRSQSNVKSSYRGGYSS